MSVFFRNKLSTLGKSKFHTSGLSASNSLGYSNPQNPRRGFALILSLTVTLLLVTLITGLLFFVRAQQRISQPIIEQIRAEANAQLSASLALGQVQLLLGSDLRATAPAEAQAIARGAGDVSTGISTLNPNRRRVLAVFDTTYPHRNIDYPIIGPIDANRNGPYAYRTGMIDRRYSTFSYYNLSTYEANFNNSQFNWMLNSIDDDGDGHVDDSDSETEAFAADERPQLFRGYLSSGVNYDPTVASTDKSIVLSTYSYPDPLNPSSMIADAKVEAQLLDSQDISSMKGSFGYLVEDLSLRASLRPSSEPTFSTNGYSENEWDWAQALISQNVSISGHQDLPDTADTDWQDLGDNIPLSIEEAILAGIGTQEQWEDAESGYTLVPNRRVLSSSRIGSLQGDLSAYLQASDQSLASTPFANTRVAKQNAANASKIGTSKPVGLGSRSPQQIAPIVPGLYRDELGPTFESFRRYTRLQQEHLGSVIDHYFNSLRSTDNLGGVWASSWQSILAAEQGHPIGTTTEAGGEFVQRLHPIMLEGSVWWAPTLETTTDGATVNKQIFTHLHPKVTLWNPYSVDLPKRAYIVALPLRFRFRDEEVGFETGDRDPWRLRFKFRRLNTATNESGARIAREFDIPLTAAQMVPDREYNNDSEVELYNNPAIRPSPFDYHVSNGIAQDMHESGVAIHRDYALFYLEPTVLEAGECLVFSVKRSDASAGGGTVLAGPLGIDGTAPTAKPYEASNIKENVLSADNQPNGSSYYIPSSVAFTDSLRVAVGQDEVKDDDGNPVTEESINGDGSYNPGYDERGHLILSDSEEEAIQIDFDDYQIVDAVLETGRGSNSIIPSRKATDVMLFSVEGSDSNISEDEIFTPSFTAQNLPLIQRTATSTEGSGDVLRQERLGPKPLARAGTYEPYINRDNDGDGRNDLGSYLDMGNNTPVPNWGATARIRKIDDQDNYENNFGQTAETPDYFLRHALLSYFNVRSIANFHSAADHFLANSHSSHTFGSWFSPRNEPELFNNSVTGFYRSYPDGKTHGSPFMHDTLSIDAARNYIYFDIPTEGWNPLSLVQFRHADFSPYPWSTSYPIGHGMADYRTATDSTIHALLVESNPHWQWGRGPESNKTAILSESGSQGFYLEHLVDYEYWSGYTNSEDFSKRLTTSDTSDILLYDHGYTLNHYLLDDFFLSSLDYGTSNDLKWDWSTSPLNSRIYPISLTASEQAQVESSGYELAASGVLLEGAFNPNSTDVNAWTAFLSSLRGATRETINSGTVGDPQKTLFGRTMRPASSSTGQANNYFDPIAHSGAYLLSDDQIRIIAEKIVEVNLERGPALTLSDFISRPLTNQTQAQTQFFRRKLEKGSNNWTYPSESIPNPKNPNNPNLNSEGLDAQVVQVPIARRSRLEEAILRAELNTAFLSTDSLHTMSAQIDRRKPQPGRSGYGMFRDGFRSYTLDEPSNTDREILAESELIDEWVTWGLAGFITQQDILEPLAPALTTRGDTFTIRCFGSSMDAGEGSRRYLEITVQRFPEFLHHEERNASTLGFGNRPQDVLMTESRDTAEIKMNSELTNVNRRFGRRFQVVSQRWISEDDL